MIKNYLKIALRNIKRHKGYSLINIAGLAIGMACCLLITIWVLDELNFDRFHENAPDLYRVEENQHYSGKDYHVNVTPYPLAPALEEEIPEIIDATRYVWAGGKLFRYGDKAFFESYIWAVDTSFFQMFTFPLLKGDKNTVLDSPSAMVISEDIAEKYFGSENPIGKVISVNNQYDFEVTGVMKEIPHNSTLKAEILFPYTFLEKTGQTSENFGSNSIQTFVQLQENTLPEIVNQKIHGFIRTRVPESVTDLVLMPFTRIHLHSYFGWEKESSTVQYVYIFSMIALFVLLIACINFMNLSTARSTNRAKEVGLRKVVGAMKGHLIRQFYGESVLFAFISLIFAVIIVTALLPSFGKLAAKDLSWNVAGIGMIFFGLLAITLFTGIVAGSYPALFLSAFQPIRVLRGGLKSGASSSVFRKILVVVQFSLSILLIIGTVVVYKQLDYMKKKRLGWDKEQLLYVVLRGDIKKSYEVISTELRKDPRILGVSASSHLPSDIYSNSSGADWEGKDPEQRVLIGISYIDFDYIETLKIEMVEGRSFSRDYSSDSAKKTFIVNEEVAKLMEKESVVGERFSFAGVDGTIIGVMKNFHFKPVRDAIEPLALTVDPEDFQVMLIRVSPEDISGSLQFVENTWKRIIPLYPFEYRFMDERFDRMYRAEERIGTILKYFAILAVFIACLGLFGLASFTAERRTKEIGIRKVLGASVSQVTALLCREFLILVALANIIAWPAAYFVMDKWLRSYAYRTSLGWLIFVVAMAAALVVAVISVSFQAVRAALANPADSLRYE